MEKETRMDDTLKKNRRRQAHLVICLFTAAVTLLLFVVSVLLILGQREVKRVKSVLKQFPIEYEMLAMPDETLMSQYFVPQYNYLEAVQVYMANLAGDEAGKLHITISDQEEKVLFEKDVSISSMKAGDYHPVKVDLHLKAGERYLLEMYTTGVSNAEGLLPTMLAIPGSDDVAENHTLLVDYQESELGLIIGYQYKLVRLAGYTEDETNTLLRQRIFCVGLLFLMLGALTAYGICMKKRRWPLVLTEGLLLILFFQMTFTYGIQEELGRAKRTIDYNVPANINYMGQVLPGNTLVQTFGADKSFAGVELYVQAEGKEKTDVSVMISDADTKMILGETVIRKSEMEEPAYVLVPAAEENPEGENRAYEITLQAGDQKSRLIVWGASDNRYPGGSLTLNGNAAAGDLKFRLVLDDSYLEIAVWMNVLFAVLMGIFCLSTLLIFYHKCRAEHVFLALAILFGAIYLYILPPNSAPDTVIHGTTAYHYSNVLMGIRESGDAGKMTMRSQDVSMSSLYEKEVNLEEYLKIDYFGRHQVRDTQLVEANSRGGTGIFLPYIPSMLGITLARLLKLDTVALMRLGEAFNLAVYIGLLYWAIRRMPFGKKSMLILGICPMAMHLAASFSYDPMLLGTSYCFIAYVLHLAYGETKKVTWKELAVAAVLLLLLVPQKGIYVLLGLLVLLIPRERLPLVKGGTDRRHWKKGYFGAALGAVAVLAVLLAVFNLDAIQALSQVTLVYGDEVVEAYSLLQVLQHPFHTLGVYCNTLVQNFAFLVESVFGGWLGWTDIEVNPLFVWGFLISFLMAALSAGNGKEQIRRRDKYVMGVTCILIGILAGATMLLGCTPSFSTQIIGLQGRYFLPFMPLVACILGKNQSVRIKSSGNLMLNLAVFFQILTIVDVLRVTLCR